MKQRHLIYGFWDRFDEAVAKSGQTKNELARRIGCSRKSLYRGNGTMLSPMYIARFCVITGTSSDYLLGIKTKPKEMTDGRTDFTF